MLMRLQTSYDLVHAVLTGSGIVQHAPMHGALEHLCPVDALFYTDANVHTFGT